jgi:hypothetical protein
MRLIFHIGTQKTGSTALQRFLRDSSKALISHGIHYAAPRGALMANSIANALNVGETAAVRTFLEEHSGLARGAGAETVLVSAENFYGMSALAALRGRAIGTDPIERERDLIQGLQALIPDSISVCEVACYFRRPDRYAESRYNQEVKRDLFAGRLHEFLQLIEPALSYHTCISLWSDVFGQRNCTVRTYEEAIQDGIAADFTKHVLGIKLALPADQSSEMNERVSRDLLEFKRQTNGDARRTNRITEYRILRTLERKMRRRELEPDYYQDFFSPRERADFLACLASETDALVAAFNLAPFPLFDVESASAGWRPYPGLSAERLAEIRHEYMSVRKSPSFLLERAVRRRGRVSSSTPIPRTLLRGLRRTGLKRVLLGIARRGRPEEEW